MPDADRYTFSSLMTLLIDNQGKLKRLYDTASIEHAQSNLKPRLSEFTNRIVKQINMMRRTRMQSVVEMTLEPISDLNLTDLLSQLVVIENDEADSLKKIADFEKDLSELYVRCSARVAQMSADAAQLLTELSQECMDRARWLSEASIAN